MELVIASSVFSRLQGLFGRKGFDGVLMLLPCNDIHTFGMRAAIDVAFVASDGEVVESHRRIPPNRRLRNSRASATLERFSTDDAWFQPGDRFAMNQEEGTLLTCCQMRANA